VSCISTEVKISNSQPMIELILGYIIVAVHTPLAAYANLAHDDSLLMSLGRSLSEGTGLGKFSQFTLMKGPRNPAFSCHCKLALDHGKG
jgi:hypothetical protein